eukprot:COSAG06_NODE_3411_length_5383_cov_5.147805_3_plen_32_part_01
MYDWPVGFISNMENLQLIVRARAPLGVGEAFL